MRIPLDYYRILGLPIQATAEQLKQAHRDRTLQLPRREYSESAIEARKSLIDEAYSLLSDAERRQVYDKQFFNRGHAVDVAVGTTKPSDPGSNVGEETLRAIASDAPPATTATEPYTPKIEIDDTQFVGALLILLELGEYELVIRLGRPFLIGGNTGLENGRHGNAKPMLADIVLTLALACLELGREQWQQSQYENAAESLETGQELLLRENVFPGIRAELQSDLYKLRPYRILELVARPLEQAAERRQGIQLLKAMLHDRGGIDGA
ncbi:MAG: J domain-containing protein, partial [Cyanobacteria bacterium J06626_18]